MKLAFFLVPVMAVQVFLVPHSHCDHGWLTTIKKYYSENVQQILNNLVVLLQEHSERKFTWAETAYLGMWLANSPHKDFIQDMVDAGRLEIAGGGVVQSDEASPDFEMLTRQLETGHSFLHQQFGLQQVAVAWQIDAFGHSAHNAAVLAAFGYKYLVINRIEKRLKVRLS